MKCPSCGLINPDTALRCDCGYDFASNQLREFYLTGSLPPEKPSESNNRIVQGSARFISGHTRAQSVFLAFGLTVALALAGILLDVMLIVVSSRVPLENAIANAGDEMILVIAQVGEILRSSRLIISCFLYPLTSLTFLLWLYRAYKNLPALGASHLQSTPGSAMVVWFIPVLNFYFPYKVVKELWRWCGPEGVFSGKVQQGLPIIGLWWLSFLLMTFLGRALEFTDDPQVTAGQVVNSSWISLIYGVLTCISAALAVYIVRRTDENQEGLARLASTTPRIDRGSVSGVPANT